MGPSCPSSPFSPCKTSIICYEEKHILKDSKKYLCTMCVNMYINKHYKPFHPLVQLDPFHPETKQKAMALLNEICTKQRGISIFVSSTLIPGLPCTPCRPCKNEITA